TSCLRHETTACTTASKFCSAESWSPMGWLPPESSSEKVPPPAGSAWSQSSPSTVASGAGSAGQGRSADRLAPRHRGGGGGGGGEADAGQHGAGLGLDGHAVGRGVGEEQVGLGRDRRL